MDTAAPDTKYVYIKIKIDNDTNIMKGLFVSEDREHINKWRGVKKEISEAENVEYDKPPTLFQKVSRDFEEAVNVFQRAMPFVMISLPLMLEVRTDNKVRKFLDENAKRIESLTSDDGAFEVHQISIYHVNAFSKIMADMGSIRQGIAGMPEMFIVSLISMYDAFLSQLIRTTFLTKPEILSASDKNISFKDLVESESIEAARERIIEKEIESVMRQSHVDQIRAAPERVATRAGVRRYRVREEPADAVTLVR